MNARDRHRRELSIVTRAAPLSVFALALQVACTDPATPGPHAGQSNGRSVEPAGQLPTARKRAGAAGVRGASTSLGIAQSMSRSRPSCAGGALGQ